ncbi:hypothetical protein K439DRAFT_978803 [Ramaria rubella]|nr:hypothetical protein K439DRAFT_978803 [Ramaria rubella]
MSVFFDTGIFTQVLKSHGALRLHFLLPFRHSGERSSSLECTCSANATLRSNNVASDCKSGISGFDGLEYHFQR